MLWLSKIQHLSVFNKCWKNAKISIMTGLSHLRMVPEYLFIDNDLLDTQDACDVAGQGNK